MMLNKNWWLIMFARERFAMLLNEYISTIGIRYILKSYYSNAQNDYKYKTVYGKLMRINLIS